MRRIFTTLYTALICCCPLFSSTEKMAEIDSLRTLITHTSPNDTMRLFYLQKLAVIQQSSPEGIETAYELLHEATRLHHNKYECYGTYYPLLYYYNNGMNTDSIEYYAQRTLSLAEKEKLWGIYFEAKKLHINTHIMHQEFEYSIEEALKMHEKAKSIHHIDGLISANITLATAYIGTERYEKGINALQDAYIEIPNTDNQITVISLLSLLISTSKHKGAYDLLFFYLQELTNSLDTHLASHPFSESYNSIYLLQDIYYAYYYLATDQNNLAYTRLKKAEKHKGTAIFDAYKDLYYDAYADYYYACKAYNKAIAAIDSSVVGLQTVAPKDYYRQLTKKAQILSESGQKTKALALYQESLYGKDSIDRILLDKQMDQIQEMCHVNKLLLENEKIRSSQQIIFLIIIILAITLLTIFTLRSLSVRRRLREAKKEIRRATKMAEEANEVKNFFLSNMSYNIRIPLNSVVGFSQLIALEPDIEDDERKEYSTIIKENADKLLNLVNDVLDQSRLEAGMMKFSIQPYDVVTLCHEAIYTAKSKGQPIEIHFQPQIEEQSIQVDTHRFSQLLVSLLTYPTKGTDKLTITFTVALHSTKEFVQIKTIGSPIASPELITQEVSIRNEVNQLYLARFGGTYEIIPEAPEGPTVILTYPLNIP